MTQWANTRQNKNLLHKVLTAGLLCGFVCFANLAAFTTLAHAQEQDPKQDTDQIKVLEAPNNALDTIEKQRNQTNAELGALQSQTAEITQALERLNGKIDSLKKDQEALQSNLDDVAARRGKLSEQVTFGASELTRLEQNEADIKTSLGARNAVLAEVLAALQRLGSNPPPALLVKPEDALSSIRSAILLGAVVPEIRSETEKLVFDLEQLAIVRNKITDERTQLATAIIEAEQEENNLKELIQERASLNIVSLQQLEREKARLQELTSKSEELSNVMASLDLEIKSIKELAEQERIAELERKTQAEEQLERARIIALRDNDNLQSLSPAFAFSRLQNTLPLPVEGVFLASFGEVDPSGEPLEGIKIATQAGAEIKAPVDGWVVYSGPFRSYGNLLILDAGEGYHFVFAGMDEITIGKDQFVLAGEPIGTMGTEPVNIGGKSTFALASGKPTLYIELRKNQKTIDSTPWWAGVASGRVRNDT